MGTQSTQMTKIFVLLVLVSLTRSAFAAELSSQQQIDALHAELAASRAQIDQLKTKNVALYQELRELASARTEMDRLRRLQDPLVTDTLLSDGAAIKGSGLVDSFLEDADVALEETWGRRRRRRQGRYKTKGKCVKHCNKDCMLP